MNKSFEKNKFLLFSLEFKKGLNMKMLLSMTVVVTLLITFSAHANTQSNHLTAEIKGNTYREIPVHPHFTQGTRESNPNYLNFARKVGSKILINLDQFFMNNKKEKNTELKLTDINTGLAACPGGFYAYSNNYHLGYRTVIKGDERTGEVINMATCDVVKTIDVTNDISELILSVSFNEQLDAVFIKTVKQRLLVPISNESELKQTIQLPYSVVGVFGKYAFEFKPRRYPRCSSGRTGSQGTFYGMYYETWAFPVNSDNSSESLLFRRGLNCLNGGYESEEDAYKYVIGYRPNFLGLHSDIFLWLTPTDTDTDNGYNEDLDTFYVSMADGTLSQRKLSFAEEIFFTPKIISNDGNYSTIQPSSQFNMNMFLDSPLKKVILFDSKNGKEAKVFASEVNYLFLRDTAFYGLYSKLTLDLPQRYANQHIGLQGMSIRSRSGEQLAKFMCSGKRYLGVAAVSADEKYLLIGCTQGDNTKSPIEKLHMFERTDILQ